MCDVTLASPPFRRSYMHETPPKTQTKERSPHITVGVLLRMPRVRNVTTGSSAQLSAAQGFPAFRSSRGISPSRRAPPRRPRPPKIKAKSNSRSRLALPERERHCSSVTGLRLTAEPLSSTRSSSVRARARRSNLYAARFSPSPLHSHFSSFLEQQLIGAREV